VHDEVECPTGTQAALCLTRSDVDRKLRCDCGFEALAPDQESLVAEIRRHAWEAHRMPLSRAEALLLIPRVGLVPSDRSPTPFKEDK
jgi:hypothetical protein